MRLLNAFAAAAMVAAVGCVETAGTRVTIDAQSGEASVYEGSTRLANRIKVVRTTYDTVGGIKKATVTIVSKLHSRQHLQARMIWLDADGSEIDAGGKPFRAVILDGNDTYAFTGMAPNERAVKAKLVIRETDTAE